MEYTTTLINSEGQTKTVKILNDNANAKIIIARFISEQKEIAEGSLKEIPKDQIERAAKKRLSKFIANLRKEFNERIGQ